MDKANFVSSSKCPTSKEEKVCLCFGPRQPVLDGYTDANMSGDIDSSKSTLVFTVKVSFTLPRMQSTIFEPNVGKLVPPDGNRTSLEKETTPDGSRRT